MNNDKKTKKIGLCVCQDSHNFGSQLQVLATLKSIEKYDVEYEIIDYKKKLTPKFIIKSLPRLLNIGFVSSKLKYRKKMKLIKKDNEIYQNYLKREKEFNDFAENNFKKYCKKYYGYKNLKKGTSNYDGFLVGSDQLWLPSNYGSNFYNFNFVPDNKIKISYATSFGVGTIPWYQRKKTEKFLKRINYLSVREESGKKIIKDIANIDAKVVLDPTLLLTENNWKEIIPEEKIMNFPYILCYFLGDNDEYRKQAEKLKKILKLPIVSIPNIDSYSEKSKAFGDYKLYEISSDKFVNLIRNAECVLTDSFHGSVFSIINHKNFIIFDRFREGTNSRNSRIDNLCNIFDISNKRYKKDIENIYRNSIDYEKVDKILLGKQKESLDFLGKAIEGVKNNGKI